MKKMRQFALSWLLISGMSAVDWPQFLGPSRNGSYPADASGFSLSGAKLRWKKQVGAGFSAPVVSAGKLILFHREKDKEIVDCLDAASGKSLWSFDYTTTYRDDFGFDEGPRGTPAISDGRVYTFGAEGVLHAIDFSTGKKIWRVDTQSRFGVRKGFFGAAASPLVDGKAVYLNVGGPNGAGMVAFNKDTGDVLWNTGNDDAGYSSPSVATLDGVRSILFFTRDGLVAADPLKGTTRFRFVWRSRTNASVNAALPVVAGNLIFLSASYNTGAALLEVHGNEVKKLWSSDEALSNHYATSVYSDGYLYGYHGRQEFGQALRCIEMATGKVMWNVEGFGAGTVTLLGKKLLVVLENGEAQVADASPKAFQPTAKLQLLPAVIRSYPAVSDGSVYVRNENTLAAWDMGSSGRR